ncbi:MAG TPA: gliding motility-associated ABC transporter substrate-binding protein GldG [Puia sp.]|nr:gliding motility-associated ABC transporter substrate-binding protein GldG [Puia sp.]
MKKKFSSKYSLLFLAIGLILLNFLAAQWHYRFDLTAEKRYSLSDATKKLLRNLDKEVDIDVFLKGDLKKGIKKLKNSTEELLREFNEYGKGKIHFNFFDPLTEIDDSAKAILLDSLARMGIQPMTQVAQSKKGEEESQRIVIPAAIVKYDNRIFPVDLLKGVQKSREGQPEEQLYVNAETLLEYKFANAIDKLAQKEVPAIGYVLGNGEPLDFRVYDLIQNLRQNYLFGIVRLDSLPIIPDQYQAIIIVKPIQKFTDAEKLKLDQFTMHGGNIIWMIDNLNAEMDSLQSDREVIAFDRGLNLEDIFFKYGARVNLDLVEDMQCASIDLVVGSQGGKPQTQLLPWPYFPLLDGNPDHPISKNLDPVYSRFANSIDTVKAQGIKKTVLLQTSKYGRTVSTPAMITFESIKTASDPKSFNRPNIPVAMLLEGNFNSLYVNRMSSGMIDTLANIYKTPFLSSASKPAKVVICADADITMNEVGQRGPLPLGLDKDINFTFANKDFVENCVEYLVNQSGILETRSKDFTLRLLDTEKIEEEKSLWQFINIGLPVLLIILSGLIYQYLRKRKYQFAKV